MTIHEAHCLCPNCMARRTASDSVCAACGYDPATAEVKPQCLPPGIVLQDRWVIGNVLGQGGFGITYIGFDMLSNVKVAIKEYFPSTLAFRDTVSGQNNTVHSVSGERHSHFVKGMESFRQEAQFLMKLRKLDGIVHLRDFIYAFETAYIIMDFVEGLSLKAYLEQHGGVMSEQKLLSLLEPIMGTLDGVHALGMIHRDISPDNLIISPDGKKATLIDFGAARYATGEATQDLTSVLKPGYAPVEQYTSRSRQGPFTDVYALCALMYKALSGITPVDSMTRSIEQLELISLTEYVPNLSPNTAQVIIKGMSLRPEDRYQSIAALKAALEGGKGTGSPVIIGVKPENSASNSSRSENRRRSSHRTLWIGIALGLSAAVAAIVLLSNSADIEEVSSEGLDPAAAIASSPDISKSQKPQPDNTLGLELGTEILHAMSDGTVITCKVVEDGLALIAWDSNASVLSIPQEIDGIPITAIGAYAFYQYNYLEQLNLPEGLLRIEEGAFAQCLSLPDLTCPDSLVSIGDGAFWGCSALTSIKFSSSLTSIGSAAFEDCMNLSSAALPESLESIGSNAFAQDVFLRNCNIPGGAEEFGSGIFSGCTRLTVSCVEGSPGWEYMQISDIPWIIEE